MVPENKSRDKKPEWKKRVGGYRLKQELGVQVVEVVEYITYILEGNYFVAYRGRQSGKSTNLVCIHPLKVGIRETRIHINRFARKIEKYDKQNSTNI